MRADFPDAPRFIPPRPLPPIKVEALRDLARGPLHGYFDGPWGDRPYNTHTVTWLATIGYARLNQQITKAEITEDGLAYLGMIDQNPEF